MIRLEEKGAIFNYRVAGVAVHGGRVLLHRAEEESFWSLPGGRAEILETAEETLRREMDEELHTAVRVERLVWVIENFFEYMDDPYHELGFYFLMHLPDESPLVEADGEFEGDEEGTRLFFRWFAIEEVGGLHILPSYLRTGLAAIPDSPVHVVHRDGVV